MVDQHLLLLPSFSPSKPHRPIRPDSRFHGTTGAQVSSNRSCRLVVNRFAGGDSTLHSMPCSCRAKRTSCRKREHHLPVFLGTGILRSTCGVRRLLMLHRAHSVGRRRVRRHTATTASTTTTEIEVYLIIIIILLFVFHLIVPDVVLLGRRRRLRVCLVGLDGCCDGCWGSGRLLSNSRLRRSVIVVAVTILVSNSMTVTGSSCRSQVGEKILLKVLRLRHLVDRRKNCWW